MTYLKEHKEDPFPKQVVLNLDPQRLNEENDIADWFGRIYFQRAAEEVERELKHCEDKSSLRDRMLRLIGLFKGQMRPRGRERETQMVGEGRLVRRRGADLRLYARPLRPHLRRARCLLNEKPRRRRRGQSNTGGYHPPCPIV